MPIEALFHRDDGKRDIPGTDSPWTNWVSASRTRNYIEGDPVLDWLDLHGEAKGFVRDDEVEGYDERTDFGPFVMAKGVEFEGKVVEYLASRRKVVTIVTERGDARNEAAVRRTWEAMVAGTEIIAQAPIWNPQTRTYGIIDLLVRSDILAALFPKHVVGDPSEPAPDIPGARWHYRIVDIKFSTLQMLKDGHAGSSQIHYAAQVWLYNAALGRLQGLLPGSSYLLGRGWQKQKERGHAAFEALSRIDHDHEIGRGAGTLGSLALAACDWVRKARTIGASWTTLPAPSVPELRPNMRNAQDAPWHRAKRKIADDLEDLTVVPRVNPAMRNVAVAGGLERWRDPACSAARLGVKGDTLAPLVDAVIAANHSPSSGPTVFPEKITAEEALWREPAPVEFFVDFETVNDLDDDFSSFPKKGGQPLIFMVGCGYTTAGGKWQFDVFTTDHLVPEEEKRILDEWIARMRARCAEGPCDLSAARIYHWSPAEVSTLESAYNSAAARHGLPDWNSLPWIDLLAKVIKAQPVTVRGAFGFGLKAVTKAMHAAGLIGTAWPDSVTDGLGAMVGAWWCDREARQVGTSMRNLDLMKEIEKYNQVDVEAMRDVLGWLRRNR